MALKDSWKKTGSELGHAFRDLGKSLGKTAATAVHKVDKWADETANSDEKPAEGQSDEPKQD